MVRRPVDDRLEGSPLLALARYLSDEIPPMLVVDEAELLLGSPEAVVRTVRAWISSQYAGSGSQPFSDYVFHAVKKLHLLAELELVDQRPLSELLRAVIPVLVEECPAPERSHLLRSLEAIGHTDATLSSPVEFLHRPGRAKGGEPDQAPPAAPAVAPPSSGISPPAASAGITPLAGPVPASAAAARGMAQLNLLLDRLERLAHETPRDSDAALAASDPRHSAVLAEIVQRISEDATTSGHLGRQLDFLGGLGLPVTDQTLIRQLGRGLPDWLAPPPPAGDATTVATPLQAIRRVVGMARGDDHGMARFSELVAVAVEEFNGGHLGRAATLFELASQMVTEREVDTSVVRAVVGQSFAALDQEHLRTEAEHDANHAMLRRVVAFFPRLSAEELLLELEVESKRDRRRFLIEVLRIHGAPARRLALKALRDSVSGERPLSWYVERNMIHLLRRVPRPAEDPLDPEVEVLSRSSQLEGPLPLVRESLAGLGSLGHPAVEKTLISRVGELEEALIGHRELPHDGEDLRGLLDRVVAILAAGGSEEARRCVVEHGLRRKAALGDTAGRMAALGKFNLVDQPTVLARILEALQSELPPRVFGVTVATARRSELVERLLDALAGSDTPEVRSRLAEVAEAYPNQRFADRARTVLAELGASPPVTAAEEDGAAPVVSLAGDLTLFGLPNLLQNLADNRLTGVLAIEDDNGRPVAVIRFSDGLIASAATARLRGETAVFELVEVPRSGRFGFTRRALEESELSGSPLAVTGVLLEGMRRFDELARARAIVADGARFTATATTAPRVDDEPDEELVASVWQHAAAGRSAAECGAAVRADSFRVRRLLARWVVAGALKATPPDVPRE